MMSVKYRYVCGIDPGLGSGALVVIDRANEKSLVAVESLVPPSGEIKSARKKAQDLADFLGGWSDIEFLAADIRARAWMVRFCETFDRLEEKYGAMDIVAMESFVDQHQHAKRMMRNRWQVPFLMGLLLVELDRRGINPENRRLVYQNAGIVLSQLKGELEKLKERRHSHHVILPGDEQVSNEHKRSAFGHALSLSIRLDEHFPFTTTPMPEATS